MSKGDDLQLDEAFRVVTCVQVARHFGLDLQVGVQKSPFRQDKKGASFSLVPPDGRFFTDFTDDELKGGAWKFAQLCAEHCGVPMSGKEIRDLLVTLSGQEPKALKKGTVKRQVREKREKLYADAERAARELPILGKSEIPGPWSGAVCSRWMEGGPYLTEAAEKLAASRGWDVEVLDELAGEKTSCPVLPWGRGRGWAWLVEKPVFQRGVLSFVPVGYHARYKVFQTLKNGEKVAEKRWVYVPYIPQKASTDFQEHLRSMNTKLPAYPFVLSSAAPAAPRLVVILEGQFDAVSFAAACGWFADTGTGIPEGVYVFGLRGVQSQKALLAAYGLWLRKHKPFIWIIGDNDAAGRKIDAQKAAELNKIAAEPSFADRLRAQGCTVHQELIRHPGCKDFNDVYKAARPSMETMRTWARHVRAPEVW